MRTSEQINEVAAAMAKAQGAMKPATKDSTNPHFRSKYADITAVWEACRGPLSSSGLAVWQDVETTERGAAVTTRITHSSGQWMEFGPLLVPTAKQDAHGVGSATSYARRYALAAAVGIVADEDDDANAAVSKEGHGVHSPKPEGWNAQDTKKTTEYQKRIHDAVNEGRDVLEVWDEVREGGETFATAVWSKLSAPIKEHIKDQMDKRGGKKAA